MRERATVAQVRALEDRLDEEIEAHGETERALQAAQRYAAYLQEQLLDVMLENKELREDQQVVRAWMASGEGG